MITGCGVGAWAQLCGGLCPTHSSLTYISEAGFLCPHWPTLLGLLPDSPQLASPASFSEPQHHSPRSLRALFIMSPWLYSPQGFLLMFLHGQLLQTSHMWAEANALRRASETPSECARSPSGTTLLCTGFILVSAFIRTWKYLLCLPTHSIHPHPSVCEIKDQNLSCGENL